METQRPDAQGTEARGNPGATTCGGGDTLQLTPPLPASRDRKSTRWWRESQTSDCGSGTRQHGRGGDTYRIKFISRRGDRPPPGQGATE